MKRKKITINIIDFLFFSCILLFFVCEYRTGILFIDKITSMLEEKKIKYLYVFFITIICFFTTNFEKEKAFYQEFIRYILGIFVLALISLFKQILNGFNSILINEIMYYITPLIFSFFIINRKNGKIEKYIDYIFYIIIILFLTINIDNLFNVKKLLAIDFINSSSPFESGFAFYLIILLIYYTYKKDKLKAIVSFAICVLSLKRITFLFSIIFLIFKNIIEKRKVNYWILIIAFLMVPILFNIVCNDTINSLFYDLTGMDFNVFLKGRFEFINLLFDSTEIKYGLGSCKLFLSNYYKEYYSSLGYSGIADIYDPHCDIVRFYLECTIIGSLALNYAFFKNAKNSNISTFITFYIFVESCFNHVFGSGNTVYWILVYLVIYYFNYEYNKSGINEKSLSVDKNENTY